MATSAAGRREGRSFQIPGILSSSSSDSTFEFDDGHVVDMPFDVPN